MAFFQLPCFTISARSTFNWLAVLLVGCGMYSFRRDFSMYICFTHLLIESIAAAPKGLRYVINKVLVSACTLALQRFKYSFKQSTTHNFVVICPIVETVQLLPRFWMFKNMIKRKCNSYICNCHFVYCEKI